MNESDGDGEKNLEVIVMRRVFAISIFLGNISGNETLRLSRGLYYHLSINKFRAEHTSPAATRPHILFGALTRNGLGFRLQSTSLDGGSAIGHQPGPGGPTVVTRNAGRRWLSQNSQSRQHSAEDGVRGGSVGVGGPVSTSSSSQAPGQNAPPALPPRRISPAADTGEIANAR